MLMKLNSYHMNNEIEINQELPRESMADSIAKPVRNDCLKIQNDFDEAFASAFPDIYLLMHMLRLIKNWI